VYDFAVVVDPADRAKGDRHGQHDPHETVRKVTPQQRGDDDRNEDQRAAHRRRAGLRKMRLGTVGPNGLADFVRRELAYHRGADDERKYERGQACEHRAQRDVIEDIEDANVFTEPLSEL
jgi:hypothetical protein